MRNCTGSGSFILEINIQRIFLFQFQLNEIELITFFENSTIAIKHCELYDYIIHYIHIHLHIESID